MTRVSGVARGGVLGAMAVVLGWAAAGCDGEPAPASSYYDEQIGPKLEFGCAEQTTGCHIASEEGEATGNLDLTSYDALMRRSDVLPAYGPYPVGLLFLKAGDPVTIGVETFDPPDPSRPNERVVTVETDIRHNAGRTVRLDSSTYAQLKQWVDAGFTRSGVPREEVVANEGPCNGRVGRFPGFDRSSDPTDAASWDAFQDEVQPVLERRCAGSSCHGSEIADLYLTCGDDPEQLRWNYFIALQHVNQPASTSELLRRPLAQFRGGTYHEGGPVFASTEDPDYQVLRRWADDLVARAPELLVPETEDEGLRFFANRVQPVLVRKGCMFLNCHSTAMFHDLRLRGGSQGAFSRVATIRNHEMSRLMLALESPDVNDSRIVAKNLYPPDQVDGGDGIAHRGGALFEDFGAEGAALRPAREALCEGVDADGGDLNEIPAYCVLERWHEIEREEAIARGEIAEARIAGVVWVSRPVGSGGPLSFDTFAGGADLRLADASLDAEGSLTMEPGASLLGGCGLGGDVDVRTPAVSWDGTRVAFAARGGASEPLRLYWMNADGTGCEPIPGVAPGMSEENGILTHDFDPAFAPDGRIVFASTRGNLDRDRYPYEGPTRTPAAMAPNANLYILDPDAGAVRQLTYLLNQELSPSFMNDGRVIFTAEKREPEFHQLALRRQNLDGGDYHPLFAQRGSVGFRAATEGIELPDRNFAFIASSLDAVEGAGALAVVNRSIGPDQDDRPNDDRAYIPSLRLPVPGAVGGGMGVYRSPARLPSDRVLVSCDREATSVTAGGYDYQLCEIDPDSGRVREVGGEPGRANVDAVALFARGQFGVFDSRPDEANGNTRVVSDATDATIHVHDFPLLGTLLFANTREGRPIDPRIGGFDVFEAHPPPAGATTFADVSEMVVSDDFGQVYVDYQHLGWSDLYADGSAFIRIPGGTPVLLRVTDGDGDPLAFGEGGPFTGEMIQREQMQFYPGERSNQSLRRDMFNGLCGGCHGSLTNRELDIGVDVDVLTSASHTHALEGDPVDMLR